MGVIKRVICLANSRKLQGRCVAGRELIDRAAGPWIRPVSDRPSEEVSEEERRYENGTDPKILDIIDIPLIRPQPKGCQRENWLLDPQFYWVKSGAVALADLTDFSEGCGPLWINGQSTNAGLNDRIPVAQAKELDSSLKLIFVENLDIRVFAPGEAFGNAKRRVQAKFRFDSTEYWLWITDPIVEREYLLKADGTYSLKDRYLTVSIGEPHEDYCYKLVATVIGA
jgi:hypothetical protein